MRDTEEMRLWLFDLSHDNLTNDAIVKGFIKHYVLNDLSINDVKRDIVYHAPHGVMHCGQAITSLDKALQKFVEDADPPAEGAAGGSGN